MLSISGLFFGMQKSFADDKKLDLKSLCTNILKSSESGSKLLSNDEVLFNKFVRFQVILKHSSVSIG